MTDLNTLIPAGSPLFLIFGGDINSGEKIAGYALEISTGEVRAFLATPSDGGAVSAIGAPEAGGETTQSPKITLPENARKLLQQMRFGRLRPGLIKPQ